MIVKSENNGNYHLKKNFHQFVMVDNQNIFDIKEEIELHFFANYNEDISVNLAS